MKTEAQLDEAVQEMVRTAGYVTWDAQPPVGLGFQTHKFSICDAFAMGFSFMRTDCIDESLILGPCATAIVRTLPMFVRRAPILIGTHYVFIGTLCEADVYIDTRMAAARFLVLHGQRCVLGVIHNIPLTVIDVILPVDEVPKLVEILRRV